MPTSSFSEHIRVTTPEGAKVLAATLFINDVRLVRKGDTSITDPEDVKRIKSIISAHPDWSDYEVSTEVIRLEEENEEQHITDFNQEHRSILEQGINLLRYGFDEEQIREFMEAVRKEPEMAEFINQKMNTWGPGLEYEEKRVWSTAQPPRMMSNPTERRLDGESVDYPLDN